MNYLLSLSNMVFNSFIFSVSQTTRRPKPNEKNKIDYNFIKMQEFEQDVTQVSAFVTLTKRLTLLF